MKSLHLSRNYVKENIKVTEKECPIAILISEQAPRTTLSLQLWLPERSGREEAHRSHSPTPSFSVVAVLNKTYRRQKHIRIFVYDWFRIKMEVHCNIITFKCKYIEISFKYSQNISILSEVFSYNSHRKLIQDRLFITKNSIKINLYKKAFLTQNFYYYSDKLCILYILWTWKLF